MMRRATRHGGASPNRRLYKLLAYSSIIVFLVAAGLIAGNVMQTRDAAPSRGASVSGNAKLLSLPDAGKNAVWSVSDLAWVLEERIVLDVMEAFASAQEDVEEYNERVLRYNDRASAIVYRDSEMEEAVRLVEAKKAEIVRSAVLEASSAPKIPHGDEEFETIWRAQSCLAAIGFYLGRVDGRMDGDTEYAIMSYQVDIGLEPTGTLDGDLLSRLEEGLLARYTPEEVGFKEKDTSP